MVSEEVRAGPDRGACRGSSEEVNLLPDQSAVDTSGDPSDTCVLVLLSGGPNRKPRTDAWTGAPVSNSDERGQGGGKERKKFQRP